MLGRKKKMLSPEDLAKAEANALAKASYLTPDSDLKEGVSFDFTVVEDEKILALFDPYLETENGLVQNPNYVPLLKPLLPFVSRLCYLTNCSELAADVFKCRADYLITLLKARASTDDEYDLLDALEAWVEMRINDSIRGSKIQVLTTRRREVTMREEKQKRGWRPW